MEAAVDSSEHYTTICSILQDSEAVDGILRRNPDTMTIAAREKLARIAHHFRIKKRKVGGKRKAGEKDNTDDEVEEEERAAMSPNNPWKRIHRVTEVQVPEYFQDWFMQRDISNMDSNLLAQRMLIDTKDSMVGRGLTQSETDFRSAFSARMSYTTDVDDNTDINAARQRFSWLMWYDMICCIKTTEGVKRVPDSVVENARPLLRKLVPGQENEALDLIRSCFRKGRKINSLWKDLGPGCIFLLTEKFSTDFVEWHMTESGDPRRRAIKHLCDLGIEEHSKHKTLVAVAEASRRFLAAPFAEIADILRGRKVLKDVA